MEPDPADGAESLEDDTPVHVFACPDGSMSRGAEVALTAAALVAALAPADAPHGETATRDWVEGVRSRFALTPSQAARLQAKVSWQRYRPQGLAKILKALAEATDDEKRFHAASAVDVAVASGGADKATIAVLEKIHDRLGVSRNTLYSTLHSGLGRASQPADGPVEVASAVSEPRHPLPAEPDGEPVRDEGERLARIRAETERVSNLLADIFVEDPPDAAVPAAETGKGEMDGLDAEHSALVSILRGKSEWPRSAFDTEARQVGLLPDGAMETINEWAYDHLGEALLEDGDTVLVHGALLHEWATAAE